MEKKIVADAFYLEKPKKSIFIGLKCREYPNLPLVRGFIQNQMGIKLRKKTAETYSDEQTHYKNYLLRLGTYRGEIFINTSYYLNKSGWGRINPTKSLSLSLFHRPTRHSFAKDIYTDFDMVNCQLQVILEIALKANMEINGLKEYCENPKEQREAIAKHYKLKDIVSEDNVVLTAKEQAKKLPIRLAFGGSLEQWKKDFNVEKMNDMPMVVNMNNTINEISKRVKSSNSNMINDLSANEIWTKKTEAEKQRSLLAQYAQTYERILQEYCIAYLVRTYKTVKLKDVVPCQDGFMVLNSQIEGVFVETLIEQFSNEIMKKFKMNIEWSVKPFDEAFDIPEEDENCVEETIEEINDIDETETFEYMAKEFEKTHAKIVNGSQYVKKFEDRNIIFTERQLLVSYSHLCFKSKIFDNKGNLKEIGQSSFIERWISHKHPDIKQYDEMGIYPEPTLCPKNVYNLWIPFRCQLLHQEFEKKEVEKDFILNHIKILCNNEQEVYDYFIKWIAQMIQYPHIKTVMPTIISKQGAGKGTLMKLFKKMLGDEKVIETTTPSRDVWGQFNSLMATAFLVNLNELSKKETADAITHLKALVTDPKITINTKGISAYTIKSYCRFIGTTNTNDPMVTESDDRRNLIMRASDKLIGNKDYFNEINGYLEDDNVIMTCFEYFKSIPDMNKFGDLILPVTEYHANLKDGNKSIYYYWLQHFMNKHCQDLENYSGEELLKDFNDWKNLNGFEYKISSIKLGVGIKALNYQGITKERFTSGMVYVFNFKVLRIELA